jgi:hypothetical protein
MHEKLIIGYKAASDLTGIPVKRLIRMVERRSIRVIKPNVATVAFYPSDLLSDIRAFEVPKIK